MAFYSNQRLLGDHVPYAIEAWPEGNQRHLSAESGLYNRIITEGMFGIRPVGFNSFTLTPRLPAAWDSMKLRNIKSFSSTFDIEVNRAGSKIVVKVTSGNKTICNKSVKEGSAIAILL